MNEYEKYRLQWMLDHDYSLPDLLERLSDIAMNENLDEIQNPRVMLNEAFEDWNMNKDLIMKKSGYAKMNGNMIYTVAMNIV